jgi:hypothetical protein
MRPHFLRSYPNVNLRLRLLAILKHFNPHHQYVVLGSQHWYTMRGIRSLLVIALSYLVTVCLIWLLLGHYYPHQ